MLPKIVFLDRATLTVPLRPLGLPHEWAEYPHSSPEEAIERLKDATVAITNKVVIDENTIESGAQPLMIYAEQAKISGSN